jgi:hypothetical protein
MFRCATKKRAGKTLNRGTSGCGTVGALSTELPGIATRAGFEPATTRFTCEVSATYTTGQHRCYRASYKAQFKSAGEQTETEHRCPGPLDDSSSRSRQDSNLRLPRGRRSIRDLHHRLNCSLPATPCKKHAGEPAKRVRTRRLLPAEPCASGLRPRSAN